MDRELRAFDRKIPEEIKSYLWATRDIVKGLAMVNNKLTVKRLFTLCQLLN